MGNVCASQRVSEVFLKILDNNKRFETEFILTDGM